MNKRVWIVGLLIGFILGVAASLALFGKDIDLLAESVEKEITLAKPLIVTNSAGHRVEMPQGTGLLYTKKYRGIAHLRLEIVTEDLSTLQFSDRAGIHTYFSKQK